MSSQDQTLRDRARLTREERAALPDFEHSHNWTECDACEQYVADAATDKALYAVVEWLAARTRTLFPQEDRAKDGARLLVQQYTGELLNSGIERPRETAG